MSDLSPELRVNLLYEDIPHYALWLKIILLGTLGLTLFLGFYFLAVDLVGAFTCFGITIVDAFIFNMVFPRRYQVFTDRLRIAMGGPFAYSIPFDKIKTARVLSGKGIFRGSALSINFVTSTSSVVEIVRRGGWAVTISPSRAEAFAEHLNQAIQAHSP